MSKLADKAIAAPVCGFDKRGRLRIVLESVTQLTNGDFEHCIGNESFRPDGGEQLFFSNELTGTLNEFVEDCVGFRSELNDLRATPQTLVGTVQAERLEDDARFVAQGNYRINNRISPVTRFLCLDWVFRLEIIF